jgi:phosphatidate cytidylyltransferase
MKKIIQRLLVFFIGLPIIFGTLFLLPQHRHLVFNLLVVIFSALGAVEFSVLLAQKKLIITKIEAAILGALPPLVMILDINLGLSDILFHTVFTAVVSWLLISRIFYRRNMLDNLLNQLAAGFAVLLYPSMLMAWIVRMSLWESASIIILIFLIVVFFTDGVAWVTGMLFGKGNQGIIAVSPHKSIAGFIGGAIASIVIGAGAALLCPDVFVTRFNYSIMGIPSVAGALLGLLTGAASVLGDLGESAIKRSSGLKDSGTIIPGRGGVLDSIDSIALAGPVYYLIFSLLFKP